MKAATGVDTREAQDFLRWLGAPRVLVAIHPDNHKVVGATPNTSKNLIAFLTKYGAEGFNLYFTPNRTKRPISTKPKKADIRFFDFAHVELDPPDTIKDLAAWQKRARAKLKASPWPPSVIWSSGNGVQALWRIDEPLDLADVPAALCESKNRGLLEAFADDEIEIQGTWNVDRILRIPGTINYPNAKKRAAGRKTVGAGHAEFA